MSCRDTSGGETPAGELSGSERLRVVAEPRRAPVRPATGRARTVLVAYGCDPAEAELFATTASAVGLPTMITGAPLGGTTVELARGVPCVSVSHRTRVTRSTLRALRDAGVAYVSSRSVGLDHIDVGYARSIGLTVENVCYSPAGVADFALMGMLMIIRRARSSLRRVDVHDYRPDPVRGRELQDLTVGVVGTGRIGSAVIDRLHGFGCRILANDPHPSAPVEYVDLDALVSGCDIVSLHSPLTDDTYHLLDRRRIESMRPGSIVINTGRGALIDTEALLDGLVSGRLGGAALDVVEEEDGIFSADLRGRPVNNPTLLKLQHLPNVLISPHVAYYTDRACRDMVTASMINCREFERGHRDESQR